MPQPTLAALLAADCAVKALAFALEARAKTSQLMASETPSSEERAGPISKTFFLWLNSLFLAGYKGTLQPPDVGQIDKTLYAENLVKKFAPIVEGAKGKWPSTLFLYLEKLILCGAVNSPFQLIFLTVKCLGLPAFKPVVPRLALTGFTYSQAFFVEAMLNYLDDDAPLNNGLGLIGACALVYVGMAVSCLLVYSSSNIHSYN